MTVASVEEMQAFINSAVYLYGFKRDTTVADIIQWDGKLKAAALANTQVCKANRPWTFVDFNLLLKQDQPWLGWEWETGTDDRDTYHLMIEFLWSMNHIAIDREGSGKYPFEIAFPPENASTYKRGVTAFQKYARWIRDNKIKQANNPTTYTARAIGIHVNVSTPKSRKNPEKEVGYALATALQFAGKAGTDADGQKKEIELFGRCQRFWSLCQHRGKGQYEFKLFASTSDYGTLKRYQQIALRLPALMDVYLDNLKCINVYEYLRGDEDLKV